MKRRGSESHRQTTRVRGYSSNDTRGRSQRGRKRISTTIRVSLLTTLVTHSILLLAGCGASERTDQNTSTADAERTVDTGAADDSTPPNRLGNGEPSGRVSGDGATDRIDADRIERDTGTLRLGTTLFEVDPSLESADLRLKILSTRTGEERITGVDPSCGCILATVQRSRITSEKGGEVYVAVLTEQMSDDQPYTVDILTTANPESPLRLTIWKRVPGTTGAERE